MDALFQAEMHAQAIVEDYNQKNTPHFMASCEGEWTLETYIAQFELACVKICWLSGELQTAQDRIQELEREVEELRSARHSVP